MRHGWYVEWFDSPYYHLLYRHRDYGEADAFVARLVERLALPPGARILDIACGSGRHALSLRRRGYRVLGIDLSPNNVEAARVHADEGLRFEVGDMRECREPASFDAALNLFTSFGYFPTDRQNRRVIAAAASCLRHGGVFVLDYLNPTYVRRGLVSDEERTIDGVHFRIRRSVAGRTIRKTITVRDPSKHRAAEVQQFCERVRAYRRRDISRFFTRAGLTIEGVYGTYDLEEFSEPSSPRQIVIGRRTGQASESAPSAESILRAMP